MDNKIIDFAISGYARSIALVNKDIPNNVLVVGIPAIVNKDNNNIFS